MEGNCIVVQPTLDLDLSYHRHHGRGKECLTPRNKIKTKKSKYQYNEEINKILLLFHHMNEVQ